MLLSKATFHKAYRAQYKREYSSAGRVNELAEEVGRELRCTGQGCTIIYGHPEFISRAVLLRLVRFL